MRFFEMIDLLEASKYDAMFSKIEQLEFISNKRMILDQIQGEITWARQNLKREDRIIWYLRLIKYKTFYNIYKTYPEDRDIDNTFPDPSDNEAIAKEKKVVQRELAKIDQKIRAEGILPSEIGANLRQNLMHYLGQEHIQSIQDYLFGTETPYELFNIFNQYEEEWQKKVGTDSVKIQSGDQIVISFDDGQRAWWLLDRGACDDEANAMGHCGNVPSVKSGERILSFRTKIQDDWWKPHLTFILDGNGFLGEMKGRGNKKPTEKYHPYIVALLKKTKLIKGIKGGGYLPQENFSLDDLDEDARAEVMSVNPNLQSVFDKFRKQGATPEIIAELENKHDESNLPGIDSIGKETTILNSWKSLEAFADDYDIKPLKIIFSKIEQQEDLSDGKIDRSEVEDIADQLKIRPDIYRDVLEKMSKRTVEKIVDDLGIRANVNRYADLMNIAEDIDKTEYGDLIRRAMVRTQKLDGKKISEDENLKEVVETIMEAVYRSTRSYEVGIIYDSNDIKNTDVRLETNTSNFVDMLEESFRDYDSAEDEEAWYAAASAANEGEWLALERYELRSNLEQLSGKEKYSDYDDSQIQQYQKFMSKVDTVNLDQDTIDALDVAREAERMLYYNESHDLQRVRVLAGLRENH